MRRALCIGIDDYPGAPLAGCVNDAQRIRDVVRCHDDRSPNFDCRSLVAAVGGDADLSRAAVREGIAQLFADPADVALLYFAGHGTVNDLDGYLVTQDARRYDEGVAMSEILRLANASRAQEVVIILDCCYSGVFGNPPDIDNSRASLREGVSVLTASRGDQPSVEEAGGGVFTSLVVDALGGGAADLLGQVTAPSIYAYVEAALGAWDQRPLFKSHLSRLVPIRKCAAPLDVRILRDLPTLFPLPAEPLPLDPSFEPTSPQAQPENTRQFDKLQALSRVHLVTPVGARHMYDAAMNSAGCKLTPSGRYYWRLARDGRL